jgi:chromosome partitioning protein
LARTGKRTLLIDLDPQGHSTLGMGLELDDDDLNVADTLSKRALPLAEVIRSTATPGLDIAPSTLRLAAVAESLSTMLKREERLARALDRTTTYAWTVIDCPPALGVLTANAVAASDLVIVPCPIGARALDGLEDLLELARVAHHGGSAQDRDAGNFSGAASAVQATRLGHTDLHQRGAQPIANGPA